MFKTVKNYTQNIYNDNKTIDKILKFIILLLIIYLIFKYNLLEIVIILLLIAIFFILIMGNNNDQVENYVNTTNFHRPEYETINCNHTTGMDDQDPNGFGRQHKQPTPNTMSASEFVKQYAKTNQYTKRHPTGGTGFNPYRYGWNDINNGRARDTLHNRWEHHSDEKNMREMNNFMRTRR